MRVSCPTGFRRLRMTSARGALGEGISLSVLPLILTSLTRDPLLIASLQVAAAIPWILFGLRLKGSERTDS